MTGEKLKVSDTTDGLPARPGFENASAPAPIDPQTGMHGAYWVLSKEERAKGFVRPVRSTYRHMKCHTNTTMGQAIAETYARDPKYYGATMCVNCRRHFPVGEHGEFEWVDENGVPTGEKVGT